MQITSQMVKELRDKTNAGMMDCKKALTETQGDMEKAVDYLRQKGLAVAAKRADRATSEGVVECYIHSNSKLGVLVELGCETDFVAKTDQFKAFAKDVAMHIAATNPVAVRREDIPESMIAREREVYVNQVKEEDAEAAAKGRKPKPENIVAKIIEGKVDKFLAENCLLEQKFVKNPDVSVQDLLNELVVKMGENISIKRFSRFQLGA